VAFFGNAYSSTDPDLPNSNKGQDALIAAYKEVAPVWLNLPSLSEVIALSERAGSLKIVNPNLVELYLVSYYTFDRFRSGGSLFCLVSSMTFFMISLEYNQLDHTDSFVFGTRPQQ
jgi:hypothetical protein